MPKTQSSISFRFEDNQLFIRRRDACDYRIRAWPKPNAECLKYYMASWERFYPEFRLISYPPPKPKRKHTPNQLELGLDVTPATGSPGTKKEAYDQLRRTMPTGYAMALAPFKSHQWNMIVFLSFHGRFYELIKSNPALAFTLANRREFNWRVYRREIKLEDLTGMKQTELLELVGLPGIKNVVQITKKIHPASVTPNLVHTMRECLRHGDAIKKMSHLKNVNAGVLVLLKCNENIRTLCTPKLLEEISNSAPNNHYPVAAHELIESLRWHRELRPGRAYPAPRSLEELTAYHEEMTEESTRLFRGMVPPGQELSSSELYNRVAQMNRESLPDPPIAGTDAIIPLRTVVALRQEARQQHNCVGGYIERVRSGRCYIYQVLSPERATLSIARGTSGEWERGELKAACNKPAKPETEASVAEWLSNAQLGI